MLVLVFGKLVVAENPAPTRTIEEQGLPRPSGTHVQMPAGYIPAFCNPCLFYGGDSDPSNPNANGEWDSNSSYFLIDGSVFSPFVVPRKTGKCSGTCAWEVSGLSANIEFYPYPPVMDDVAWYIVGPNSFPGTIVCHGKDATPTVTDTGRHFSGYEEYNVAVQVSGCPSLAGGQNGSEYWESVTPETSVYELAYESNVPDTPPPNAYGPPEPRDQSYECVGYPNSDCELVGHPFDIFSASVEGLLSKK
jgi:hypothetical protein